MNYHRIKPWKSPKYLQWIREQPCYKCGKESEPHHIIGVGSMSGMGIKAPDWAVMPLCHQCHAEIHATPDLWDEQWEMIVRTIGRAISEMDFPIGLK